MVLLVIRTMPAITSAGLLRKISTKIAGGNADTKAELVRNSAVPECAADLEILKTMAVTASWEIQTSKRTSVRNLEFRRTTTTFAKRNVRKGTRTPEMVRKFAREVTFTTEKPSEDVRLKWAHLLLAVNRATMQSIAEASTCTKTTMEILKLILRPTLVSSVAAGDSHAQMDTNTCKMTFLGLVILNQKRKIVEHALKNVPTTNFANRTNVMKPHNATLTKREQETERHMKVKYFAKKWNPNLLNFKQKQTQPIIKV